jgi:hypothetical protein
VILLSFEEAGDVFDGNFKFLVVKNHSNMLLASEITSKLFITPTASSNLYFTSKLPLLNLSNCHHHSLTLNYL